MRKIILKEYIYRPDAFDIEGQIRMMNENGIEIQVLACQNISGAEHLQEALRRAGENNNRLRDILEAYPRRFRAFAELIPAGKDSCARELEQWVKERGFSGGVIDPEYFRPETPEAQELFFAANELKAPLLIRAGRLLSKDETAGGSACCREHPGEVQPDCERISRELADSGKICLQSLQMIAGGVFDRYPGLRIVLGHMGEGFMYWLWRAEGWYEGALQPEGASLPEISSQRSFTGVFRDHFYLTTSGMCSLSPLQCAIDYHGADRILLAADASCETMNETAEFIDTVPVDENQRAQICYENAEELLQIQCNKFERRYENE